jgi:GMP synthase-like glutamine amidotransferase
MPAPRVLVVQLADSDPPGLLEPWLARAGAAAHVVRADALPADLDGFDALIVLGGPMGASDDAAHPFLPAVRDLLRAAGRIEMPTLGICLGAQLLAVAHGGRVERNPDGPELGAQLIAKRTAASSDPLFGPVPITPDVVQWHFDAVTSLPPGAVLLAGSPTCDVQAFRLGRLAWGVQFHIETTPDIVRAWAAADAPVLAEYDLDRILERVEAVQADVAETWEPVVAAFVDVAREPSAVRAPRGVPTASAAPITDPAAIRAALAAEVAAARSPMPMPMPHVRPPAQD